MVFVLLQTSILTRAIFWAFQDFTIFSEHLNIVDCSSRLPLLSIISKSLSLCRMISICQQNPEMSVFSLMVSTFYSCLKNVVMKMFHSKRVSLLFPNVFKWAFCRLLSPVNFYRIPRVALSHDLLLGSMVASNIRSHRWTPHLLLRKARAPHAWS